MKELFTGLFTGVAWIVGGFLSLMFGLYFIVAFMTWIFSDPFGIIPDMTLLSMTPPQKNIWDDCTQSARAIYDDFNDTMGATYATDDKPSTEVQEFMKLCLEKNI